MPRVRHVLKGKEVIEAWLNQSQDWAKTSSGSVRFEGPLLYNDCGDVCLERKELGSGHILFIKRSYHVPHYRSYMDDGYDAWSMISTYSMDRTDVWRIGDWCGTVSLNMIKGYAEDLPYYWNGCMWTREDLAEHVDYCVQVNFERICNMRTFLKGAGVTTVGELDPDCEARDIEFVRGVLFDKLDAMAYFKRACNYDHRKGAIERAFGEGTLDAMLSAAIGKHSHLLNGKVSSGCEYAEFWAGI